MFYVIGSWISLSHMQQAEDPFKWLPEPTQFSQKAFVQLNHFQFWLLLLWGAERQKNLLAGGYSKINTF